MDKSWVSAVELAEVAIHLAQLKGSRNPMSPGLWHCSNTPGRCVMR